MAYIRITANENEPFTWSVSDSVTEACRIRDSRKDIDKIELHRIKKGETNTSLEQVVWSQV